ncbi:syntaxin 7 [Pelomyxa schiedti]|nr:syntaxin 7 [Pelomyxa schiedti]
MVTDFVQNVTRVQEMIQIVGTPKDSQAHRTKLNACVASTSEQMRSITAVIKQLGNTDKSVDTPQKREQGRTIKSFVDYAEKFKYLSTIASEKEHLPIPQKQFQTATPQSTVFREETATKAAEDLRLIEAERAEFQQTEQEREWNEQLIRDREAGIQELETKVVQVNEMFRDLASIVKEQGHMIDNIEANIESADTQVEQGVEQLEKAVTLQKKSRNKLWIILAITAAVCGAIIVLILVTVLPSVL